MIEVFGIPNCDTVKKALAWLRSQGADHQFHDFKKQGVPKDKLQGWIAQLGWEVLLNRKGTTWRKLDAATQAAVTDADSALTLMRDQSSVIKRPVVVWADGQVSVGFDAEAWQARLR